MYEMGRHSRKNSGVRWLSEVASEDLVLEDIIRDVLSGALGIYLGAFILQVIGFRSLSFFISVNVLGAIVTLSFLPLLRVTHSITRHKGLPDRHIFLLILTLMSGVATILYAARSHGFWAYGLVALAVISISLLGAASQDTIDTP